MMCCWRYLRADLLPSDNWTFTLNDEKFKWRKLLRQEKILFTISRAIKKVSRSTNYRPFIAGCKNRLQPLSFLWAHLREVSVSHNNLNEFNNWVFAIIDIDPDGCLVTINFDDAQTIFYGVNNSLRDNILIWL